MRAAVNTRAGRLEGQDRGAILAFRGVRYAQPPVGALRFSPPRALTPWQGARRAFEFGASAPQLRPGPALLGRLMGSDRAAQTEDCLYLNLWTPGADDRRRPVMVWIHGGAFVMGSGGMGLYSGSRLARRGDVVVVTINYRLGALGFLDLTALGAAGFEQTSNLGIRDQITALEWVRDNIECFGGDPDNVTVFGESAGGMSVGTLLGTPDASGLFHRAIAQSGAANNVSSPARASQLAEYFLKELPSGDDPADVLRTSSVDQILAAQQRASRQLGMALGTLPWQPTVDGDLIPQQPLAAVAAGASSDVPLLIGTNREEWKLFSLADRAARRLDEAGLLRRFERALPGKDADGNSRAALAMHFYSGAREGRARAARSSAGSRWGRLQTDRVFREPAFRLADCHALAAKAGTYSYQFTWRPPLFGSSIGACHAMEIPFVFGTLRAPVVKQLIGSTRTARELSRAMQQAWIAFAYSGDPSQPGLPHWPRYSAEHTATMKLGPQTGVDRGRSDEEREFWESALRAG